MAPPKSIVTPCGLLLDETVTEVQRPEAVAFGFSIPRQ
jgi:hypothetical protein